MLYVMKLYKKQIVGIVKRKEFSNKELRVNLVTRKLLVRVIERISCFLWKSERDGKVVVDTNRIFTLKQVNGETNMWKVLSQEMCVGTRWMNNFHKKHLQRLLRKDRGSLISCWIVRFLANTMKLNNSPCYSTLTMCRVCCLSNQCVKDFVFQQELWSLSQEVLSLLWCSYCEKAISLYFKQKSLDEKSFHIISKIVNKMVSCLTKAISDIPYCMSTTTCYPWSRFVV